MRDAWLHLLDSVLRPERPHLGRCLEERERHVAERRLLAQARTRAMANCEMQIEAARAAIFAAKDGVVTARMNELERGWLRLARPDPDGGLMDLWARIVPPSWLDRKRWRDDEPAEWLDTAVALAADVQAVETAERAAGSLRVALAAWGVPVGSRIRWRSFERDADVTTEVLAKPCRAACEALEARREAPRVLERARHLEQTVHEAALERFPERALLGRALAHAAFVDCLLGAASLAIDLPNPVTSLSELWRAGYTLSAIDASGITLQIPPL